MIVTHGQPPIFLSETLHSECHRQTETVSTYCKKKSPDLPFLSHYAKIQGDMGQFLTFLVLELQRDDIYQNRVEFRQKVIGAGLNLFWAHLHYF